MCATESASETPGRRVLEGVPRVGFYHEMQQHADSKVRCPEDVPLPSCLRACLEYLGDGVGCSQTGLCSPHWKLGCGYAFLMGATGAAFRLSWKEGWHGDNVASWLVGNDAGEIFVRAFAAVGYGLELVHVRRDEPDAEAVRRKVIESIDAGRPVIAHGVIGPPEECILTGYDDGGEVVIGWNYFQGDDGLADVEFEPSGQFRKRNWVADTWSLVLIGEKADPPPEPKEVLRTALEWAVEVIRAPVRFGDRHNGLAAFDAWIEHLGYDDQIAADPAMGIEVHDDAVGVVAEGRWYASIFLAEAARWMPFLAPELLAAASCCAEQHALMWKLWDILGGHGRGPDHQQRLCDADRRRQMVPIIRQAREKDARVAEHIERALAV